MINTEDTEFDTQWPSPRITLIIIRTKRPTRTASPNQNVNATNRPAVCARNSCITCDSRRRVTCPAKSRLNAPKNARLSLQASQLRSSCELFNLFC